jgi:IS5 family transposase
MVPAVGCGAGGSLERSSFRRFLGLSLEDAAPDHTTLCRFRNRLVAEGLADKLFGEFEKQLDQRGLLLKRGTMIDASLVATPYGRARPMANATRSIRMRH